MSLQQLPSLMRDTRSRLFPSFSEYFCPYRTNVICYHWAKIALIWVFIAHLPISLTRLPSSQDTRADNNQAMTCSIWFVLYLPASSTGIKKRVSFPVLCYNRDLVGHSILNAELWMIQYPYPVVTLVFSFILFNVELIFGENQTKTNLLSKLLALVSGVALP